MDEIGRERQAQAEVAAGLVEILRPIVERAGLDFALVVWTSPPPGFATFASSAGQDEMVRALKELVVRIEQGDRVEPEEDPP